MVGPKAKVALARTWMLECKEYLSNLQLDVLDVHIDVRIKT